jgi:dihydrolipoamide dehydrogenase
VKSFDLVVIGAGPGGYVAAIRGAQKGLKTAVIESRDVGGTCLNRGCIPTKSMLHSAQLYREALHGGMFGLTAAEVGFDFDIINKRKIEVVEKLRAGTEQLLKAHKAELIRGTAAIKSPTSIVVETGAGTEEIETKHIIIATGSEPKLPPGPFRGINNIISSDDALAADAKLYKRILVSGGGVIGVEFASVYSDLGCEVTIVGSRENLLRRLDDDISKNIMMLFKKRGINIITPAKIQEIKEVNGELVCRIAQREEIKEVACDGILWCIGRKPLTERLFTGDMNVEMEDGVVIINEHMQTNIPNIYAIGDCTQNSTQLAHAASAQGINAVSHIVGEEPTMNLSAIPSCVYTSPEIATVGLMETDANAKGIEVKTSKFLMAANGKSIVSNEERGFMKLVFDAKTNVLLGAHLMCARATDIISELTCAIVNKLTAEELASTIRPHPTYVEGISEAVEDVFGMAIHVAPKRK